MGGAVGSATASWLFAKFKYALLHRQLWVWTGALALLWSAGGHFLIAMALAMAALGFTGALGNIAVDTYLVRYSGQAMFARLVSIDRITSLIALAFGPLVAGIAMEYFGLHVTLALLFFTALVLAVAAYLEPSMRTSEGSPSLEQVGRPDAQLGWASQASTPILLVAGLTVAAVALSLHLS